MAKASHRESLRNCSVTRLPRDIEGGKLVKVLSKFGYDVARQTGSHIRLTTRLNGEHSLTILSTKMKTDLRTVSYVSNGI